VNWRLFLIGMSLFVFLGVNGFLLLNEEIVPPDKQTKAEARMNDPLFGRQFTASQRETNVREYGFGPEEVAEILKKISALEERYRVKDPEFNQIEVRIEAASDPDALVSAFCGTGSTLPVRYAAMPFLVAEKGEQLKAVDVDEISAFEFQDWAKRARVQAVYEDAELNKDRNEDATRMAMAAVLVKDEQTLLEHKSPWGRGVFSGWSWDGVQKKHTGVRTRLIEYVSLMHLVLEVANREGGLCAT
jgi:hypothetical protein